MLVMFILWYLTHICHTNGHKGGEDQHNEEQQPKGGCLSLVLQVITHAHHPEVTAEDILRVITQRTDKMKECLASVELGRQLISNVRRGGNHVVNKQW